MSSRLPERDGYELRNQLIDLLGSDGREAGKAYRLKLTLNRSLATASRCRTTPPSPATTTR